jgi:hypothetical protein
LPVSQNVFQKCHRTTLCIRNPNLGAQLFSALSINGHSFDFPGFGEQERFGAPVEVLTEDILCIPPGETAMFHAIFQLVADLRGRTDVFESVPSRVSDTFLEDRKPRWILDNLITSYVLRRNVEYVLANCVIPISTESVAIITDHVALPLGWNRDN